MPPKRKQISDSESDDFNSSDSPPVKIRSKVSNVRAKQKKNPKGESNIPISFSRSIQTRELDHMMKDLRNSVTVSRIA